MKFIPWKQRKRAGIKEIGIESCSSRGSPSDAMASAEKHAGATLRALSRPSLVAGAPELNLWLRGASKSFGESQMEYFARRKKVSGLDTLNKHVKKNMALVVLASLAHLAGPAYGASEKHSIDSAHSKITMHVYKAGLFSGLAHDHEIEAPIEWGEVNDSESPAVEVRVSSSNLRVLDPEASEGTRAKIQSTMQGAEVLDVGRFPQIHFQSTAVEPNGTDHWVVHGNLDLHGQTHPVSVDVTLKDRLYRGTAVLKQTQFGITPVRIAGGTVKVKDEVKLEFSVAVVK